MVKTSSQLQSYMQKNLWRLLINRLWVLWVEPLHEKQVGGGGVHTISVCCICWDVTQCHGIITLYFNQYHPAFTDSTYFSQIPPKFGALGGFDWNLICCLPRWTWSEGYKAWKASWSSFSPPFPPPLPHLAFAGHSDKALLQPGLASQSRHTLDTNSV